MGSTGEGSLGAVPDFDELFTTEFPRLVGIAALITGDQGRAREIVQETFARALVRWARISRYDNPQAWLTTVTVRQAVRVRDRARREPVHDPQSDDATDAGDRSSRGPAGEVEARLLVMQALTTLSPQQRAVVVLHHLEDRSIADVAAHLGVREGTVKTQLSRARARIAAAIDHDDVNSHANDNDTAAEVHP